MLSYHEHNEARATASAIARLRDGQRCRADLRCGNAAAVGSGCAARARGGGGWYSRGSDSWPVRPAGRARKFRDSRAIASRSLDFSRGRAGSATRRCGSSASSGTRPYSTRRRTASRRRLMSCGAAVAGTRRAVVARELTKQFEEVRRGTVGRARGVLREFAAARGGRDRARGYHSSTARGRRTALARTVAARRRTQRTRCRRRSRSRGRRVAQSCLSTRSRSMTTRSSYRALRSRRSSRSRFVGAAHARAASRHCSPAVRRRRLVREPVEHSEPDRGHQRAHVTQGRQDRGARHATGRSRSGTTPFLHVTGHGDIKLQRRRGRSAAPVSAARRFPARERQLRARRELSARDRAGVPGSAAAWMCR